MLQSDFYNLLRAPMELIEEAGGIVLGGGSELLSDELTPTFDDRPLSNIDKQILCNRTPYWYDFRRRHPQRIMSMLHHVCDVDIRRHTFRERQSSWVVPGVLYSARMQARRQLSCAGINLSGRWLRLFRFGSIPGLYLYSNRRYQRWYNDAFRHVLSRNRYAYTCGSILQTAIRKFLEIPAAGCVLAVQPTPAFEALGFVHGQNAFAVEPEALPDLHRVLERDPERAEAIARAGQEMVLQRHHVDVRAEQIAALADLVVQRRFAGSRWRNGEIEIAGGDGGWSPLNLAEEGRKWTGSA